MTARRWWLAGNPGGTVFPRVSRRNYKQGKQKGGDRHRTSEGVRSICEPSYHTDMISRNRERSRPKKPGMSNSRHNARQVFDYLYLSNMAACYLIYRPYILAKIDLPKVPMYLGILILFVL